MTENKTPRWPRAVAGAVLMLFLGSMYAWSYFKVTLSGVFPDWTQKQITLNFTLMMCVFCLGGLLAGRISKYVPKQLQMLGSGVLMCAGFLGVSFLPQNDPGTALILLYIFYACLNGLGTGIAFNAVLSSIQPWFPDHSGLISGVLLMGMGFGSLILGNVGAALIGVVGLFSTFRIFAFADLIVLCALSPLVRLPRAEDGVPVPAPASARQAASGEEYTSSQMLRRPSFWFYFCWNICMSAGGMLVINSASSISVFYGAAATLGLLVSVFNGGGRLLIGWLMDKIGWKAALFTVNGIMLAAGALMLIGDWGSSVLVFCGMMMVGICYGSGITISSSLIRRLYGSENYASNFGWANLCTFPAAIIGPMISAALQDASTGYTTTFIMVIVIGLISLVLNFFIKRA